MSSLAAARADNFYQPPGWDPSRESRNAHQARGKAAWQAHPLRERAKRLESEGVLVVRFEVPFPVQCLACGERVAKGVRFNADKCQAGQYLSTKIWAFRFKCPRCKAALEMRTDPRAGDFACGEGLRRKAEAYSAEDAGVERLDAEDVRARRRTDPMYALEHAEASRRRAEVAEDGDARLRERQERWATGRDFELSGRMRKELRERKRADRLARQELRARSIGVVDSLPAPTAAERRAAAAQPYGAARREGHARLALQRSRVQLSGIFDAQPVGRLRAAETERTLALLQQRKASGMCVTAGAGAPGLSDAAAAARRMPVSSRAPTGRDASSARASQGD